MFKKVTDSFKTYFTKEEGKPDGAKLFLACTVVLGVLFGIFFRVYNLDYPAKEVFDEVYFPKFASQYLSGTDVYDVHPPLGKFFIALGILFFGDTFFAWRIVPLLTGVLAIFALGYVSWRVTSSRLAGLLMGLFVAVDGMFIVYSRTGLMDGILTLTIFLTLLAAINLKEKSTAIWCAVLFGLAVAIKWPAAAILLPMCWYAWRVGKLRELLFSLPWALLAYFIVVYAGEVLDGSNQPLIDSIKWNLSALSYHSSITDTHPWGSAWWTWPIPAKPVLFLYDSLPNGMIQMMTTLGNPLLWVSSTIAVALTTIAGVFHIIKYKWKAFEHPLTPLLIGYFAMWLPWSLVSRVLFLYHYFPSYVFALLILCYWMSRFWLKNRLPVIAYCLAVLAVSVWYLPWSVGWIAVSLDRIQDMLIMQSWLY
jgi:dolichyl-phosphate-mannose--protein O-mannosyl transferase